MKNYYFFNNQDLNRNKHLINYSNLSECPKKNSHYFIKPFTRLEIPNLNKLSSNKNIFISTEESTIITTEDIHKINKNDCKCICHELDKKIIFYNMNKNSNKICNCPCHLCDKSMINYSNIFNNIFQTKTKYNYIQNIYRSADNIDKINNGDFNLIDKYPEYDDLNKKYNDNDIKKQLYNFDKDKKKRIIYIKKLEHKLSISSEGKCKEYGINKFLFTNYSNSDINIKCNNCAYNRSFSNLLKRTKNILNYSSFLNDSVQYNRNKNYNFYSPNLSYSFYKEKKKLFFSFI